MSRVLDDIPVIRPRKTKLTVEQARIYLGLKTKTALYNQVWREQVPYRKRNGRLYFFKEDLDEFLENAPGLPPEHFSNK
jgi:Helix-turn-helix domain